ncbi:MAG TPA: polysaccharide biosynthesis tyrosine autokinase [Dehalococcoidia bacterium]|nr:polysaccharide biosynthesis tyrosine autokinase [Dehalococcoidia bacterium]
MEGQFYLDVIRRWWWLLLIGPILAGGTAFYYSKTLTPIYRTSSTLLINQTQNPGVIQYNDVLASERLTNTYAELVTREVVLDEVIKRLDLKVSEPQLANRITVSTISNTQLLRVTVEDANPSLAAQIANTTAQAFIDDNTTALGRPGTVSVAEQARAPGSPAKPNVKLNTILAAFLGLLVVGGISVALEYLDDTVKGGEETEEHFGLPTLGVVRRIKNLMETGGPAAHNDASEAYIQLRTNVHFAAVGASLRKLVVTGAGPGEGKSTTAAGLAVALAQAGERVVLVDTDLRRPSLHRLFGVRNSFGLTGLILSNTTDPKPALLDTGVKNLQLLPSGPQPPNPADLLVSANMTRIVQKLSETATYVVFDTPPVLSVADATILAGNSDGTILVTEAGKTRRGAVKRALTDLEHTRAHMLGIVVNKVRSNESGYYYGYKSYAATPPSPPSQGMPSSNGATAKAPPPTPSPGIAPHT